MNASEHNHDHFVEEQLSSIQRREGGGGGGRRGGRRGGWRREGGGQAYHLGVLNTYISIFPKTDLLAAPI